MFPLFLSFYTPASISHYQHHQLSSQKHGRMDRDAAHVRDKVKTFMKWGHKKCFKQNLQGFVESSTGYGEWAEMNNERNQNASRLVTPPPKKKLRFLS